MHCTRYSMDIQQSPLKEGALCGYFAKIKDGRVLVVEHKGADR